MGRQELSTWGRQMSAEPSAENTYPLEAKRQELWHNLVQGFAPSLSEQAPTPVFATTVLPTKTKIDTQSLNTQLIDNMKGIEGFDFIPHSDWIDPGAIYSSLLTYPGVNQPTKSSLQKRLFKHALEPLTDIPSTLGIHHADRNGDGIIFLPEHTERSRNWQIFEKLSHVFDMEGQPLVIEYFVGGLPSLVNDLIRHKENPTVLRLEEQMEGLGYNALIDVRYAGLFDETMTRAASIAITRQICTPPPHQQIIKIASIMKEIGLLRVPNFIEAQSSDSNELTALVTELSYTLNYGYGDARKLVQQFIGLRLSVDELYKKYPENPERAKKLLSAVVFLDDITLHASNETARSPEGFQSIVSPLTLRLFRSDFEALLGKDIPSRNLTGLSDGILTHELSHDLLLSLAKRLKIKYPRSWPNFRGQKSEEHTIEAIGIVLGFRESVENCSYYVESNKAMQAIEKAAAHFSILTPEGREKELLAFIERHALARYNSAHR